ncbi:uncharacterized protein LOC111359580 [Spodoptera litura]|uniref:Uncharacterized protein LOC111358367 n=1 Tax=Spodoptera litura TaxID=69820 RepID=A0A9J7EF22_SPOLT|nr:uncharacterized protein LOC111358367 [Spodoptera litura]XP_022830939.1 uncharacterized protein LOC111359580 [Spodoptera litura]
MVLSPQGNKCQSVPDLHSSMDADAAINITQRNPKRKQPDCELALAITTLTEEFRRQVNALRVDMHDQFASINASINNLRDEFNNLASTSAQTQNDLKALRTEFSDTKKDVLMLNTKYQELSRVVTDLQSSVNFNSANNIDNVKRIAEIKLEFDISASETKRMFQSEIDKLNQNARQCNIEICNLPEKRGENLFVIFESIASIINMPIKQQNIVAIHRVPHAHTQNSRPKNIIVKLTSQILRDNILSAYRLSKGITSDRVGLAGTQCRIYMNEHLTLRNKELFRKCREAAKTFHYKYVWVRNATILVKETDDSSAFAVRTEDDIHKKFKSNNPSNKIIDKNPS